MHSTATESFGVDRVAFTWQARFPLVGRWLMKIVDAYADSWGELAVRFLGLPIQGQLGHETTIGEALRYLAELPACPMRWRTPASFSGASSTSEASELRSRSRRTRSARGSVTSVESSHETFRRR